MIRKSLKILFAAALAVGVVWLGIFLWPGNQRERRAFFEQEGNSPLVIAHRGGAHLAPEGTMEAFQLSADLGVDILEYDTHITADGELVVIHDSLVDRTTDGSGAVNEMTLGEIKKLDAGYHFMDDKGEFSYRGQGVSIPTVREVFEAFPDMRHLIELKDTNKPELHEAVISQMWELIQEYGMEDQVMIGSFDHAINEHFQEVSNNEVAIGAGEQEVRPYVTRHVMKLNGLASLNADSLQLPVEQEGYDLTASNLMRSSRDRNIDIYYWTINDEETMIDLIEKGADGIMTDRPDVLIEILNERE